MPGDLRGREQAAVHTEDDGTASDVWQAFEVPYRNQVFRFTPETRTTDYARSASGPIT